MRALAYILFFFLFAVSNNTTQASTIPSAQEKDSVVISRHENGKVKEKQKYRHGKKHGRWISYNANGVITKIVKYKKGEFWWERLYKKGKLSKVTNRKGKVVKMKDCGC